MKLKSTEGSADLYWKCPYKTCEANNCSNLDETVQAKNGEYGYECQECGRIVVVVY